MKRTCKTTCSLLLMLLLSLPLIAQEKKTAPAPKKPAEEETKAEVERALTPTQQQALAVLDSLFDKTKDFNDEPSRIRTQAQIADALWDHDEERARRQFEAAYRAIDDLKVKKEDEMMAMLSSPKSRLRSELLRMISPRDPKLVDKLLKAIPDKPITSESALNQIYGTQTEQSSVSLDLAMGLAQEDPQRAAQLAQASLQGGISPKFLQVLSNIRLKDAEMADRLFLQAVGVAQKSTTHPTMQLLMLASYAVPGFGGEMGGAAPSNPALIEQFLNFAYGSIMQQLTPVPNAADPQRQEMARAFASIDYLSVQQMLPLFQQYMPDKAAMISNRLQQLGGNLSTQERNQMDNLSGFMKPGTSTSDLVSQADQATDPQQKDMLYMAAASRAIGAGEFDEALALLDKIKIEILKSSLGSTIRTQAAMKAMEKGDTDAAYRYAKDISDLPTRADIFSRIAQKLAEKPDLARAVEILTDAEKSLSKADNKPEKSRALLSLSAAAAKIDPPRGFEILKTAVEAINQTGFDSLSLNELDLLNASASGMQITGAGTLSFDQSFGPLARADFQRALGAAQSIEKKELSVSAQLSVCRGVLLKTREKQADNKDKAKEPTEKKLEPEKKRP